MKTNSKLHNNQASTVRGDDEQSEGVPNLKLKPLFPRSPPRMKHKPTIPKHDKTNNTKCNGGSREPGDFKTSCEGTGWWDPRRDDGVCTSY